MSGRHARPAGPLLEVGTLLVIGLAAFMSTLDNTVFDFAGAAGTTVLLFTPLHRGDHYAALLPGVLLLGTGTAARTSADSAIQAPEAFRSALVIGLTLGAGLVALGAVISRLTLPGRAQPGFVGSASPVARIAAT